MGFYLKYFFVVSAIKKKKSNEREFPCFPLLRADQN